MPAAERVQVCVCLPVCLAFRAARVKDTSALAVSERTKVNVVETEAGETVSD